MNACVLASTLSLVINIIQTLLKLFFAFYSSSNALMADALHNMTDILVDLVILFASLFSSMPADNKYHYGRGKAESLATLFIAVILLYFTFNLLFDALIAIKIKKNINHNIVLTVSFVSFVLSIIGFLWINRLAKNSKNVLISSQSLHQLSDAAASVIVFFSAILDEFGWESSDSMASIFVVFFIIYHILPLLKNAILELLDRAAIDDIAVKNIIISFPGITDAHRIRTRSYAGVAMIDAHVTLDTFLTFSESHWVVEKLGDHIINNVVAKDVVLHADPFDLPIKNFGIRQEYVQSWQSLNIDSSYLDPFYFRMHYFEDGIKIEWLVCNQDILDKYYYWAENIINLTDDVISVDLIVVARKISRLN